MAVSHPFDHVTEATLRRRQSAKWRFYPPDVLPAWIAEMDFPLADPIRHVLHGAIDDSDVGYADPRGLGAAFSPWAKRHWDWDVAPEDVHTVADVVTGMSEIIRTSTKPGEGVLIEPPIYPPFRGSVRELGRIVVEAPLLRTAHGYAPDLEAIERAYAGGVRVHLLCSPHNPTGIVLSRESLEAIATLADRYEVLVVSDEIHAPLTLPGATHIPFPTVSAAAARRSIVLTSASKTWNLAGLKAAMMIACAGEARAALERVPPETRYHAGHLGILGSRAAFTEGDAWLESVLKILDRNRVLLGELLKEHLPSVTWIAPQASYLAWLDCSRLGLGADPAKAFLDRGKVGLSPGPSFGTQGQGFARLNIATTAALLEDAVRRMASVK